MSIAELQAKYMALGDEARPHRDRTTDIGIEQMRLSHEIAVKIVREAFPDVPVETTETLAILTPSDAGANAIEAVKRLKDAGRVPANIKISTNLMRVELAANA